MRYSTDVVVRCILEAAGTVAGTGTVVCEVAGEDGGTAWEREVVIFFSKGD
jgi:hypothetical protein